MTTTAIHDTSNLALQRDLGISTVQLELLSRHGFDATTFLSLRQKLMRGAFTTDANRLTESVEQPRADDLTALPTPGSLAALKLEALGQSAIDAGQVAVVVLNGGMATRFGGRVKGVVDIVPGTSFLGLHLRQLAKLSKVPIFLLNSFATADATRKHLEEQHHFGVAQDRITMLTQRISIRLSPDGDLFRDAQGDLSFYAPGHGDVFEVLRASQAFATFVKAGGRTVMIANIDNVAATLSPHILGAHMQSGQGVTVEVAPRQPHDKGGAPVRVNGRLEIVEGFRFPTHFDISAVPVFNTNTLWVDVGSVATPYPFTWFRADKEVDGKPAVQFERLMGEVTSFVPSTYLKVPREGPGGRFLPAKTPEDLHHIRPIVETLLKRLAT